MKIFYFTLFVYFYIGYHLLPLYDTCTIYDNLYKAVDVDRDEIDDAGSVRVEKPTDNPI